MNEDLPVMPRPEVQVLADLLRKAKLYVEHPTTLCFPDTMANQALVRDIDQALAGIPPGPQLDAARVHASLMLIEQHLRRITDGETPHGHPCLPSGAADYEKLEAARMREDHKDNIAYQALEEVRVIEDALEPLVPVDVQDRNVAAAKGVHKKPA